MFIKFQESDTQVLNLKHFLPEFGNYATNQQKISIKLRAICTADKSYQLLNIQVVHESSNAARANHGKLNPPLLAKREQIGPTVL
jgi:hypothetical protein